MSTALAIRSSGVKVPQSKNKLVKQMLSAKRSLANMREKAQETIEGVVRTTEVGAAAFTLGGIQGMRAGKGEEPIKIFGRINLELGVAAVLHLGGILGFGGQYSGHLKNFGDGAFAAFAANWGRGIGYKWAKDKEAKGSTKGDLEDQISAFMNEG